MNKNQKNEGEGSKSADRNYRKGAEQFKKAGKVEDAAQQAKRSVDGDEAESLRAAEAAGKRRSAGEDPELYRKGEPGKD